jgi:type II secretory pathway component PulM
VRQALQRWRARATPREQALVVAAVAIVVATAAWTLVVAPLMRDLDATQAQLAQARADLATARTQADELAGFARDAPAPPPADARAVVERILVARGVRSAVTALQAKPGRVELTFEAIDVPALTTLLDALAREARLFPAEVLLAARTAPGSVRAELVLIAATAP